MNYTSENVYYIRATDNENLPFVPTTSYSKVPLDKGSEENLGAISGDPTFDYNSSTNEIICLVSGLYQISVTANLVGTDIASNEILNASMHCKIGARTTPTKRIDTIDSHFVNELSFYYTTEILAGEQIFINAKYSDTSGDNPLHIAQYDDIRGCSVQAVQLFRK